MNTAAAVTTTVSTAVSTTPVTSSTLHRLASFAMAAVLTLGMLSGVDGLARQDVSDARLVQMQAAAPRV